MTRSALFKQLEKAFKRAENFRARIDDKHLFKPVQACEFFRARDEANRIINQIMRDFPGEWSEAEQQFLRPL